MKSAEAVFFLESVAFVFRPNFAVDAEFVAVFFLFASNLLQLTKRRRKISQIAFRPFSNH
jgi:hypothetical protein